MEIGITLLIIGFLIWAGNEVYKYRKAQKPPSPDPYSYLKAPEQGVLPPALPSTHTQHSHPPVAPPVTLKHEITRHDYYRAFNGDLWPRWVCKCGGSDRVPTTSMSALERAQQEARRAGEAHVRDSNKAEELMAKTKGDFAW